MEYNSRIASILNEVDIAIKKLHKNLGLEDNCSVVAYRGESMDFGKTSLIPSIFRQNYSVEDELKLFELMMDYDIVGNSNSKNIEKAMNAQHYLAISRLLDISFNILVAIYFAICSDNDKNGYLFVFCLPDFFSPSSDYIEQYYTSLLEKDEKQMILSKNFKVITNGNHNERMRSQNGGFILFPGKDITRIPECFYERILIKSEDKEIIERELKDFFSIDKSSLFPEAYEKKEYIKEHIDSKKMNTFKFDYNSELEMFFKNLTYEISYLIQLDEFNRAKRMLRKYKKDLIYHTNNYSKVEKDKKEFLKEEILFRFYCLDEKVRFEEN